MLRGSVIEFDGDDVERPRGLGKRYAGDLAKRVDEACEPARREHVSIERVE